MFPEQDQFLARQITSIDLRIPVIGILGSLHAVILDGGKWHHDAVTGYEVWDYVYVHDPQTTFPDTRWGASEWIDQVCGGACQQIISGRAIIPGAQNLQTYGAEIVVRGRPLRDGSPIVY